LLKQAADANFKKLVQIVGGNGKELYALKQRVAKIGRFF
jgi:hypothetical protein